MNESNSPLRVMNVEGGNIPSVVKALSESRDEIKNLHETLDFMDGVLQKRYWEAKTQEDRIKELIVLSNDRQDRLDAAEKSLVTLRAQAKSDYEQITETLNENSRLNDRLTITQSRLDETQTQVALASLANSQAVNEFCELREDLGVTRKLNAELQQENVQLLAQVESLKCRSCTDVENLYADLNNENFKLKFDNAKLCRSIGVVEADLERVTNENKRLKEDIRNLCDDRDVLNLAVAAAQRSSDDDVLASGIYKTFESRFWTVVAHRDAVVKSNADLSDRVERLERTKSFLWRCCRKMIGNRADLRTEVANLKEGHAAVLAENNLLHGVIGRLQTLVQKYKAEIESYVVDKINQVSQY